MIRPELDVLSLSCWWNVWGRGRRPPGSGLFPSVDTSVLWWHIGNGSSLVTWKAGRRHLQEELFPGLSLEGQIGISQCRRAVLFSFSSQTPLPWMWPSVNLWKLHPCKCLCHENICIQYTIFWTSPTRKRNIESSPLPVLGYFIRAGWKNWSGIWHCWVAGVPRGGFYLLLVQMVLLCPYGSFFVFGNLYSLDDYLPPLCDDCTLIRIECEMFSDSQICNGIVTVLWDLA